MAIGEAAETGSRMDYEQCRAWLQARGRSRIEPGLERIRALLRLLGNPHASLRGIHVVGTNGKGSTSAMAVAGLTQAGFVVGSMPSPHLRTLTERIRIGDRPVSAERFAALLTELREPVAELDRRGVCPTQFEILTAAALHHFTLAGVDVAVVEAGLGGRDDASNVLDLGVKVITNVALDHQEFLGHSVAMIAANKAGVIRRGDHVILGKLDGDAQREVRAACRAARGVRVVRLGRELRLGHDGAAARITTPDTAHPPLRPPLRGAHQRANLALAVAAVDALCDRLGRTRPTHDQWQHGLDTVVCPGRLEVFGDVHIGRWAGSVIVDGAHNPHAVETVVAELGRTLESPPVVVFSAMKDKAIREMLGRLPVRWPIVVTSVGGARAASPAEILDGLSVCHRCLGTAADPETALSLASEHAGEDTPIVALGSFVLVDAVRVALGAPVE
jgi:dihydrofolate synthase/folylpolyglutamate synthase